MDDKMEGLFPITQAAAACGVSRSTLMRMEEKGLLTPAYISDLKSLSEIFSNLVISFTRLQVMINRFHFTIGAEIAKTQTFQ